MDSVKNNGYLLEIMVDGGPVEKVIYRDSNYYALPQGTKFGVRLTNDHSTRTDVHLWVDGRKAGIWRINPYSRITITRFSPSGKPFMAWNEAKGPNTSLPQRLSLYHPWGTLDGLVRAVFVPERYTPIEVHNNYTTPDLIRHRPECHMYTDGVTPYNVENRRCHLTAEEYERRINVGQYEQPLNERERGRYRMRTRLEEGDPDNAHSIIVRVIVDNDHSRYRRDEAIWRETTRPDRVPPRLMLRNPARPHTCEKDSPFVLSKKYYFDSF